MKWFVARLLRVLVYAFTALVIVLTVVAGVVWFWLPKLDNYKPEVERLLSGYLGQRIAITTLSAEWEGLNVTFKAGGVRVAVADHPGSGMRFGEILVSFSPLGLLHGDRTLDRLELLGPTIEAARLDDGRIRVGDTILGTPRGTVRRLLQGRNLEIAGGTLIWHDALSSEGDLRIENVHLLVRPSGNRRRFDFTASAPVDLVHQVTGYGIYDPQSLSSGSWTTSASVIVKHLNLARIPAIIQERLPWKSRGYIDTDFHAKWSRGVLTSASADITASDFFIPYSKDKTPLAAKRFSSTVSWKRSQKVWRLVFTNPEIVLKDNPVSVSRFELERQKERRIYSAQDVNVQDLLGVVDQLDIELPWRTLIDRLHPKGVLPRAALTLTGPYLEATGWRFDGDFRDVGWRAQERYPGVQGLTGHLRVDAKGGELSLSSSNLKVDAAHSLRRTVDLNRVEGNVKWYRWGGDWVVDVSDGSVGNDDLDLAGINLYTRVSERSDQSPFVLARFRIRRADVGALPDYLPVKRMTDKQVEWLDRALAGGEVTEGRFYLNGRLADFPYENGSGELRVNARVKNGTLDFDEKWPALAALDGVVDIKNSHFEARISRGRMMNASVQSADAWSDDFFRRDRLLHIKGDLAAPAADVVRFLRRGPLVKNPPPDYRKMSATGEGNLQLSVDLPFTRLKQDSRVRGTYAVHNATLEVAEGVEFTKVSGTVHFTESTVRGEGLKAELFGGPVRADVTTVKPGHPMSFAVGGSGEANVAELGPVVGPVLVSELAGRTHWSGRFVGGPGPNKLEVQSDLKGVDISLPYPLWKPAEEGVHIDVQAQFDDDRRRIVMDLNDRLRGELRYDRIEGRSVLTRGVLNLGGNRELPARDLAVDVKGEQVDVDEWLDEIDRLTRLKERVARSNPDRDALFDHLRTLDIDVERFRYLHRDLGPMAVAATSGDGHAWTANFSGPRAQGVARMNLGTQDPSSYDFRLTRLYWPQLQNVETATSYRTPLDPSKFARLSIQAEDFRYGAMHFGRLEFEGEPAEYAWRIRRLVLQQPELKVDAKGKWSSDQFGAQRSQVEVSAESGDFGKALDQLGLKGQVANGKASLNADLNWGGEPGDFRLAALNGDLSFKADDGRFLKLEPGSGRLLGLFNMDTLLRRFKLDFTDVFQEGLTFDRLEGKAEINAGVLHTDGVVIVGPSALLEMRGSTDLAKETYDLDVTVAPQLGGNLSLAGVIANPAAGAMIFVVQKLFRRQMAKLIRYKYRVTGKWDDPQVKPVERPVRDGDRHIGRN
jgi:uncharacterized protein (TIGR02099 family)